MIYVFNLHKICEVPFKWYEKDMTCIIVISFFIFYLAKPCVQNDESNQINTFFFFLESGILKAEKHPKKTCFGTLNYAFQYRKKKQLFHRNKNIDQTSSSIYIGFIAVLVTRALHFLTPKLFTSMVMALNNCSFLTTHYPQCHYVSMLYGIALYFFSFFCYYVTLLA